MGESETFSFARFEHLVYGRRHEDAAAALLNLLRHLHLQSGRLGELGTTPSGDPLAEERDAYFATRLASAVSALFSDSSFHVSDLGFQKFIPFHRWLAAIFGATAFGNGDHVIHFLNQDGFAPAARLAVNDRDLLKYCLLYSLESGIALDPDALWDRNKRLAAVLYVSLLSSTIVASENAQAKKEQLLNWLPPRLTELSLDDFPLNLLHDVWMNCSYAGAAGKHLIKRAINELIRSKLLSMGYADLERGNLPRRTKPVVLCIVEWFHSRHSIYRTHSVSLEALKAKYRLIGISLREASDETSRRIFDEIHVLSQGNGVLENVRQVRELALAVRPDLVYYPSVGMFPETVFLLNLRLAPIQMVALGHPATTHSPYADCVLVEDDFIGDPDCFSEKLVALFPGSMPFRPPAQSPNVIPGTPTRRDPVRIAVAASPMKVNPDFLKTLRKIEAAATVRVEFRFFSAGLVGLGKMYLQKSIQRILPGAVVCPDLPYEQYLEALNVCDLFVNPFPFGNTNGIVDTMRQGLPGVCLTGKEIHAHIDEALFRRFGLPEWLIAGSEEDYVRAAVRLAENFAERVELSDRIRRADLDAILFKGDPELFLNAVEWLDQDRALGVSTEARVLRPPIKMRPMQTDILAIS